MSSRVNNFENKLKLYKSLWKACAETSMNLFSALSDPKNAAAGKSDNPQPFMSGTIKVPGRQNPEYKLDADGHVVFIVIRRYGSDKMWYNNPVLC